LDLTFTGFCRTPKSQVEDCNSTISRIKAASKAVKRGQSGKALRILTGTGTAPHTVEQLQRTTDLFPLPHDPVHFDPSDDLVNGSPAFLKKKFTSLVSAVEPESPDVFGWDPMLFRDADASESFIPTVCVFLSKFVGWRHAPPHLLPTFRVEFPGFNLQAA